MSKETSRGYQEVLKPTNEKVLADAGKNINAYSNLMLACQDNVTFGIIEESVSTVFPDGDAKLAWKNLFNKFEPNTGAIKVRLKSEFQKMKLVDPDKDPDPWMSKMELTKRRLQIMKSNIDEEDLMLQIVNNLPKEYETVIELCEEELTKGTLTLAILKTRIRTRYQRIVKNKEELEENVALFTQKQFKGACNVCGKIGHNGADCFTLIRNKDKKEAYLNKNNRYKNRGRGGRNRNFKRENYSRNQDRKDGVKSLTAVNQELLLVATADKKFERNTWIADSGLSGHIVNHL